LVASFPLAEGRLAQRVCAPLALNQINLNLLAHVAGDRQFLCTAAASGEAAFTLIRAGAEAGAAVHFRPGTAIISIFPHDKRPDVIGNFIRSLARARVMIHGLASSPSAISAVVTSQKGKAVVRQLFRDFHFSAFQSPEEFFAAQSPLEELVRKVVAEYQEKTIKVYWLVPQSDLDLWGMAVSSTDILAGFADVLLELGSLGLKIPFLVAIPARQSNEFILCFSTASSQSLEERSPHIRRLLQKLLPDLRPLSLTPVAGIFLHGPHFGDRYGIAQTLVESLEKTNIPLLALSCTISSISLIIRQQELAAAQLVLGNTFASPIEASATSSGGRV
jgi:aspartokinase